MQALFISFSLHSKEKTISNTDGVDLYVKVAGQGQPLLYLHGGPCSGSFWFEEFFGDFMEQHFTVVYLDQRDVGRSGSPADGNYSLDRMLTDFEEVSEVQGYKTCLTLGHSFGGILQMGYAEKNPEAIKGMIMVNCTINLKESFCESWGPTSSRFIAKDAPCKCSDDSAVIMGKMNAVGNELREKKIFWKMAYAHPESEAVMNATYKDFPNWNYDYGNAALAIEDYWKNYKPVAATVQVPVLYFYGTQDWLVGPENYRDLSFPNLLLWENEGGHIPFIEQKEALQKGILAYLQKYNF